MITSPEISGRYAGVKPYLDYVHRYVSSTLSPYCEERGFALVSRVKSVGSLSEKIESGRYSTWTEIDDLVAFAIVVPTLAEEDSVVEFLGERFRVAEIRRRGSSRKAPNVFRFDSTRFIGRLKPPPEAEAERPADKVAFEVQVRSAFDRAWIVTTHALAYKSPVIDWKQQRLAAELKATAEKMDLLIIAFQEASAKVPESPWPIIEAKQEIHRFFCSAAEAGRIPDELLPQDWSRFTDNVYDLGRRCDENLKPDEVASAVTGAVDAELVALGTEKLPRSLSLWQFTLASLSKAGVLRAPLNNHWPLITPELEVLYPALKDFRPRFQFDTA